MHDSQCLRLRLMGASLQSYESIIQGQDAHRVGWKNLGPLVPNPVKLQAEPDVALVGSIPEGVLVVFRGTRAPERSDDRPLFTVLDWLNDADCVPVHSIYPGEVHAGFERSVSRLWSRIRDRVEELFKGGAPRRLFVTGHSKGGAMAFLAAWRFARELPGDFPIRVITFAAARPGGEAFAKAFMAEPRIRSTRYEMRLDLVPSLPPGPDFSVVAEVIGRLLPHLDLDRLPRIYVGVGERVVGGDSWRDRGRKVLGALAALIRGRGSGGLWSPAEVVTMHAIAPGSYYARLAEELPNCDHG